MTLLTKFWYVYLKMWNTSPQRFILLATSSFQQYHLIIRDNYVNYVVGYSIRIVSFCYLLNVNELKVNNNNINKIQCTIFWTLRAKLQVYIMYVYKSILWHIILSKHFRFLTFKNHVKSPKYHLRMWKKKYTIKNPKNASARSWCAVVHISKGWNEQPDEGTSGTPFV